MIVDDSSIARAVLSRMLSGHKEFEVVALAGNAAEAIDALKSVRVDIVLLDVEMPGTTGLEALPEILRLGDGARVLIVSSLAEDGAEAAVRALALGAADTLPKPGTGNFAGRFSQILAERLRRIGHAERGGPAVEDSGKPLRLRAASTSRLGCVALGDPDPLVENPGDDFIVHRFDHDRGRRTSLPRAGLLGERDRTGANGSGTRQAGHREAHARSASGHRRAPN